MMVLEQWLSLCGPSDHNLLVPATIFCWFSYANPASKLISLIGTMACLKYKTKQNPRLSTGLWLHMGTKLLIIGDVSKIGLLVTVIIVVFGFELLHISDYHPGCKE